jgi:hypothetical protein
VPTNGNGPQWQDLVQDLFNALEYSGQAIPDPTDDPIEDRDGDEAGANTGEADATDDLPKPKRSLAPPRLENYYLGHLVLLQRNEPSRYLIYDGQQRLTTLTLLLCAMRDLAGGDGAWLEVQSALRTQDHQARLSVPGAGNALGQIVDSLNGTRRPGNARLSPAAHRMYDAAEYFIEKLGKWSAEQRRVLVNFLMNKVFVTVTILKDRRVAEYAYITVNTRGKTLKSTDILKGHFTQLASLRSLEAAAQMSAKWERLERDARGRLDDIVNRPGKSGDVRVEVMLP